LTGWNGRLEVVGNGGFAGNDQLRCHGDGARRGICDCQHGHGPCRPRARQHLRERGRDHRLRLPRRA
jgi:hypothetical protein